MTKPLEKKYEKPKVRKQDKMVFPTRGLSKPDVPLACRQCSSCHGCR